VGRSTKLSSTISGHFRFKLSRNFSAKNKIICFSGLLHDGHRGCLLVGRQRRLGQRRDQHEVHIRSDKLDLQKHKDG
jgi:hypothetical protein